MEKQYHVAKETCQALEGNHTVRPLVKATHQSESRHPRPVIEWATTKVAPAVSRALMDQIGREEETSTFQVKAVNLLDNKTRTFICLDLFLDCCDDAKREDINQSTNQPIHFLFRERANYYSRRTPHLDGYIARNLERSL